MRDALEAVGVWMAAHTDTRRALPAAGVIVIVRLREVVLA